jgi:molybdenum-dependent DNA-binding transcriptional regulator ModE
MTAPLSLCIDLLEAISREGSISAAGRARGGPGP